MVHERESEGGNILLSSGSALNKCLNNSVFLVAFPVHISHTLSLNGSATNSYSAPSMISLGQTSGGWAFGSLEASRDCAGRRPRCSRQSNRRRVAAWCPAL